MYHEGLIFFQDYLQKCLGSSIIFVNDYLIKSYNLMQLDRVRELEIKLSVKCCGIDE